MVVPGGSGGRTAGTESRRVEPRLDEAARDIAWMWESARNLGRLDVRSISTKLRDRRRRPEESWESSCRSRTPEASHEPKRRVTGRGATRAVLVALL